MIALQHVEKGRSIALLPSLAADPRYRIAVRPLTPPVTRRITAAIRRPATPRPEITAVLTALRRNGAKRALPEDRRGRP
jgi:hypothetical protein